MRKSCAKLEDPQFLYFPNVPRKFASLTGFETYHSGNTVNSAGFDPLDDALSTCLHAPHRQAQLELCQKASVLQPSESPNGLPLPNPENR